MNEKEKLAERSATKSGRDCTGGADLLYWIATSYREEVKGFHLGVRRGALRKEAHSGAGKDEKQSGKQNPCA